MVKFFSFPFLNASAAGSGNVRGQASGSGEQGGQPQLLSLPFEREKSELSLTLWSPAPACGLWVLLPTLFARNFVTRTSCFRVLG